MRDPAPWQDITIPLRPGMPTWPDDPELKSEKVVCLAHGDICTVSKLTIGTHTGTHMDGYNHFVKDAPGVDAIPLDHLIGPARVIETQDPHQITAEEITAADPQPGDRLLFKTQNSRDRLLEKSTFQEDFVHLSESAARLLGETGVSLVGVDYLSVGGFEGNVEPVHHALLGNRIAVVEGLNLADVAPGEVDLICLPIRLENGDGGLARALVRPRQVS